MQLNSREHQSAQIPHSFLHPASMISDPNCLIEDVDRDVIEPTQFCSHFMNCMEMYADARTVSEYFDDHYTWFRRCAQPMQVESLGKNGYELIIGQFGAFGYEVEPRIGLNLLPQDHGVYRIETVPIPGYATTGYEVDFRAAMQLVEISVDEVADERIRRFLLDKNQLDRITQVNWKLDLTVIIQFPRFIHALPKVMIRSTGDRLLRQVVRQVSNRLTYKVLEDFHATNGVQAPKPSRKGFF